jgi:hypothetical protein
MTAPTPTTPRLPDWQARWAALCADRQDTPFTWGVHDCCMWAADAVQALQGWDPAQEWRGTYATALGAARLLADHGGVQGFATAALGVPVAPLWATVGDVVLIEQPEAPEGQRHLLALCNGASALAAGPHGLLAFGMGAATAAWKV